MKVDKYIQYILFICIVLYFAQGSFYQKGSFISQGALLIIFIISIKYFLKTLLITNSKPMFFIYWTGLLVANIFLFLFSADFSDPLHFSKIKGLFIITLPFYPVYYFSKIGILKAKHLKWLFLIILPIVISQFYFQRASILQIKGSDNIVNNLSYMFCYLIPFLFLFKEKKIISIICSFILIFFIIQGAKRGALVVGGGGMLFFFYYQLKTIDKRNKLLGYIFFFFSIGLMIYLGYDYYLKNEFLVSRIESISEGSYSGRDTIYANIFNSWYNNNNIINVLFGFGFGSSLILSGTGNWAHNDWLEGLAGFGLTGIFLYMMLFISAFHMLYKRNWESEKKILLLCILTIWFLSTLVSMNYYNATNTLFQYIVLAYLVGNNSKEIE